MLLASPSLLSASPSTPAPLDFWCDHETVRSRPRGVSLTPPAWAPPAAAPRSPIGSGSVPAGVPPASPPWRLPETVRCVGVLLTVGPPVAPPADPVVSPASRAAEPHAAQPAAASAAASAAAPAAMPCTSQYDVAAPPCLPLTSRAAPEPSSNQRYLTSQLGSLSLQASNFSQP